MNCMIKTIGFIILDIFLLSTTEKLLGQLKVLNITALARGLEVCMCSVLFFFFNVFKNVHYRYDFTRTLKSIDLNSSVLIQNVQELIDNEKADSNIMRSKNTRQMSWDDYYTIDEVRNINYSCNLKSDLAKKKKIS